MSMMTYLTHYDFCSLCLFMYVLIWVSLDNSAMMLLFLVSPHFVLIVRGNLWCLGHGKFMFSESCCGSGYVGYFYSYVWKAYVIVYVVGKSLWL